MCLAYSVAWPNLPYVYRLIRIADKYIPDWINYQGPSRTTVSSDSRLLQFYTASIRVVLHTDVLEYRSI
jgi:hypothetical protein